MKKTRLTLSAIGPWASGTIHGLSLIADDEAGEAFVREIAAYATGDGLGQRIEIEVRLVKSPIVCGASMGGARVCARRVPCPEHP